MRALQARMCHWGPGIRGRRPGIRRDLHTATLFQPFRLRIGPPGRMNGYRRLTRSSAGRRSASLGDCEGCGSGVFPRTDYRPRSSNTRACSSLGWVSCVKVVPEGSAWIRQRLRQSVPSSFRRVSKLCTGKPWCGTLHFLARCRIRRLGLGNRITRPPIGCQLLVIKQKRTQRLLRRSKRFRNIASLP